MSEEKDWVQEAAIRGALLDKAEARIAELEEENSEFRRTINSVLEASAHLCAVLRDHDKQFTKQERE